MTATGQTLQHKVSVGEALSNVTKGIDFGAIWKANRAQQCRNGIMKGIGISCSYRGVSLGAEGTDAAGVGISIQTDGSIVLSCGLVDMGQGAGTTISIVAAEELGVTVDRIRFLNADTTSIPDSGPTVASRTSLMAGNAARIGAAELLKRIKPVAAEMLGCPEPSLIFKDNQICSTVEINKTLSFGELAAECFRKGISLFAHGWYKAPSTTWDEHTGQGDAYFTYVYGANLAEVEVDIVTGQVKVVKFASSHDIGRTLNLNGAKGQVYGGVAMGLGYALLEDYSEENGLPSLQNFDEYLLPTICDLPEVDVTFIENPDSIGPFGAKSLGEPACELAAPAIVNAVANAIGKRVRDLPLTLERVLLGKTLVRGEKRGSTASRSQRN